ncbi:hypothetical protein PAMA_008115 [Pampus argenteus]
MNARMREEQGGGGGGVAEGSSAGTQGQMTAGFTSSRRRNAARTRRVLQGVSLIKTECRFKETQLSYRWNQINRSSSIRGGALCPVGGRDAEGEDCRPH